MEEILEELDLQQAEQVSGGNAQDTVTGSFVESSPGREVCYAVGDYFGISRLFTQYVCEP